MRILYLTGRENALYNVHRNRVGGVWATEFFTSDARLVKVARRIFRAIPFGSVGPFFADWLRRAHEFDVILVTGTIYSYDIGRALINRGLGDRLVHWFWNPLTPADRIDELKALGSPVFTFDPKDAHRYGLRLETTYYFSSLVPSQTQQLREYDIFFVGGDKGRLARLLSLQSQFESVGLRTHFHITDTGHATPAQRHSFAPPVPYADVVNAIQSSNCLLDIVQAGQSGLTQRPMEALFHERKLITNDAALAKQDFYRPQNIFILGQDDFGLLHSFVRSPYLPVEDAVRERYDFRHWIARVAETATNLRMIKTSRDTATW